MCCALAAYGLKEAGTQAITDLRRSSWSVLNKPFPSSFLKHADEQTVVGLAAVLQAIEQHSLAEEDFTNWGILAAPRFFGRAALAISLQRFALEGAWGVSPHVVPHNSQHSLSGTVSQALSIHGPNIGVGGGLSSAAEGALVAAAMVGERHLPGLWLVLTGWNPEPILMHPTTPARNGTGVADRCHCKGIALALKPLAPSWRGTCLRIRAGATEDGESESSGQGAVSTSFSLEGLWKTLTGPDKKSATWQLPWGGWIELENLGGGPEKS